MGVCIACVSEATIAYLLDTTDLCPNRTQVYITHWTVTLTLLLGNQAKCMYFFVVNMNVCVFVCMGWGWRRCRVLSSPWLCREETVLILAGLRRSCLTGSVRTRNFFFWKHWGVCACVHVCMYIHQCLSSHSFWTCMHEYTSLWCSSSLNEDTGSDSSTSSHFCCETSLDINWQGWVKISIHSHNRFRNVNNRLSKC